jgi:hypothetical protein
MNEGKRYNQETGELIKLRIGHYVCPSRWCRIKNYVAWVCHYEYYQLADGKIENDYVGD